MSIGGKGAILAQAQACPTLGGVDRFAGRIRRMRWNDDALLRG
jgi:hypothetical protein